MRNYEVNFIIDPVLSGDEVKATATKYIDWLKEKGVTIVAIEESGLRPLAYPINKRHSGIYYCVEYSTPTGEFLPSLELALKRDEKILRFLNVSLDKFGIKYNDDKRNGRIGTNKRKAEQVAEEIAQEKLADSTGEN